MVGLRWLYPGMRLKRWFFLMAFAVTGLVMGFSGFLGRRLHGVHYNSAGGHGIFGKSEAP